MAMTEKLICGQLRELDLDFRSGRFVALYGIAWRIEFMPSESKALVAAFGLRDVKLRGMPMANTNDRVLRVTGVDMEGAT